MSADPSAFCVSAHSRLTRARRDAPAPQDPLLLLNEEYGKFESDKKKFISLIDHQSQKRTKLLQQTQHLTDNIAQIRASLLPVRPARVALPLTPSATPCFPPAQAPPRSRCSPSSRRSKPLSRSRACRSRR